MTDIAAGLAEPFPKEMLRTNEAKRGLVYVPVSEVIARLNRVLGWDGWSYEVIRLWEAGQQETESGVYPVWVMAHVRLTVQTVDLDSSLHDGVGGQQVKLLSNGKGVVDLGDEYKGAVSDALKKAAQHFGVGLDLARREEALRWESIHDAPLADAETHSLIRERINGLDVETKAQFARWYRREGFPSIKESDALTEAQASLVVDRLNVLPVAEGPSPKASTRADEARAALRGAETAAGVR